MALMKKVPYFTCFTEGLKQKKKREKENTSLKNGSILLEELIATCNGLHNPIRTFSIEELQTATNNFRSPQYHGEWYKGTLDDRPVLIKKYYYTEYKGFVHKETYRDIAISIKMSGHSNVLKLLGCCLALQNPILVFEDAHFGPLDQWLQIHSSGSLSFPWKKRLKVAKDIAHALTFLHTAFSRPIVHRDIKHQNIFLNKDYEAKLTDFSLSICIPEGETIVEDRVVGTMGYLDPEYMTTSYVSEQSDVYSFGAFMLELLIGKPLHALALTMEEQNNEPDVISEVNEFEIKVEEDPESMCHDLCTPEIRIRYLFKDKAIDEVVDSKIWEEEGEIRQEQRLQFQAFLQLAFRCTEYKSGDRPLMIDVAKELRQIERSNMVDQPKQSGIKTEAQ